MEVFMLLQTDISLTSSKLRKFFRYATSRKSKEFRQPFQISDSSFICYNRFFFNLFRPAVFMTFFLVWISFFTLNFNALTLTVSRHEIDTAWKLSWILVYFNGKSHWVFPITRSGEDLEAIFHMNWVSLYVNECTESYTFSTNDGPLFHFSLPLSTDDGPLFHTS